LNEHITLGIACPATVRDIFIIFNPHQKPTVMKSIGSLLVIFGVAAIVLGFMNKVPSILEWIYKWGEGGAWAIKIGFVVLGVVLYVAGNKRKAAGTGSGNS
jgi:hypothetical protein